MSREPWEIHKPPWLMRDGIIPQTDLEAGVNYARNRLARMTPWGIAQGVYPPPGLDPVITIGSGPDAIQVYTAAPGADPEDPEAWTHTGEIRSDPTVGCDIHGPMHFTMASDWWICHGFDGEGCDSRITAEQVYRPEHFPGHGVPNVTVHHPDLTVWAPAKPPELEQ
jgi:hypothetical protein